MTDKQTRTLATLGEAVENDMDATYTLVYIEQGMDVPDDVAAALVKGEDWIDTRGGTALDEWASEVAWVAACDQVDELAKDIVRRWEADDDADYSALLDVEWPSSDERLSALDTIRERDRSDWLTDLVNAHGSVLLRIGIPAMSEDAGLSFQPMNELQFLDLLEFPYTERNVLSADEVIGNASPEHSVVMGYAMVSVDLSDILALPADGKVDLIDPHVWLGSAFTGSGWCSEYPFTGTLTVDRDTLRTDGDAFGCSWSEVVGGISRGSYAGTIKAVRDPLAAEDKPPA